MVLEKSLELLWKEKVMQISSKNFIASQALYGLMISKPETSYSTLVKDSYKIADLMMKQSKKKKRK